MSWMRRLFGDASAPAPPAATDGELRCAFCNSSRREVRKLVAGPTVSICDRCIRLSADVIDETERAAPATFYFDRILAAVGELGPQPSHAVARPLLAAAIALAAGAAEPLRRVFYSAVSLGDDATALLALGAIAPAERTPTDALNMAAMLTDLGRCDEALAALDEFAAGPRPAPDGTDDVLHRLHRALAELERGGLSSEAASAHLATAGELADVLAAMGSGTFEDDVRAERLAVAALAALALGRLDAAERAARARIALRPDNPAAREHLARVLTARGDAVGAREALELGLARAHPDGAVAARIRRALG